MEGVGFGSTPFCNFVAPIVRTAPSASSMWCFAERNFKGLAAFGASRRARAGNTPRIVAKPNLIPARVNPSGAWTRPPPRWPARRASR